MRKLIYYIFLCSLIALVFTCNKSEGDNIEPIEEPQETPVDWQTANDVIAAESVLKEIINIIFTKALQSSELNNFTSGENADTRECPEETVTSINNNGYPKVYTLDFGESCDVNGSMVSGTIQVRFSAPVTANNTTIEVLEMTDFVLNTYLIELKNDALFLAIRNGDINGNKKFEINTNQLSISAPDGQVINLGLNWSSLVLNEMETFFEALGYEALQDDRFEYNIMNATFENNGITFSAKSIPGQPLVFEYGCRWIKGGQMQVNEMVGTNDTPIAAKILDFGYEQSACDNLVLATVADKSEIIECP